MKYSLIAFIILLVLGCTSSLVRVYPLIDDLYLAITAGTVYGTVYGVALGLTRIAISRAFGDAR